jgi:hypothetical protein
MNDTNTLARCLQALITSEKVPTKPNIEGLAPA